MKWNKDQLKVIESRNKNVLVSAAAGSGKTSVLVERIIRLVRDEFENIDSFLIVTFTNAAAAGMKQKIQKAIYKALNEHDLTDVKLKKHLRNQLNLLAKSNISTIHSFCIDVLKKNFHTLGIDPNFRVGDSNECKILLNEAIDEVLEQAYGEKNIDFLQLVESFTNNRTDTELADMMRDVFYFIRSYPEPFVWLKNAIEMLDTDGIKLKNSVWMEILVDNIKMMLEGAIPILDECEKLTLKKDGPLVYKAAIDDDKDNLNLLLASTQNGIEAIKDAVYSFKHATLKSIKKQDKELLDEYKIIEFKQLRDEYKKIIDSVKKIVPNKSIDEMADDIKHMYHTMKALRCLIEALSVNFEQKKSEKGIVDFGDIEHFALKALSVENVSNYYKNKFNYIFVDEYQDSNQLQETLVSKIKRDNNVFMVGDSKQSIYKFRLADVDLFNEKMESYKLECEVQDLNQRIDLNSNYRSRKEILNGTNYLFSKIMSKKLGELNYDKRVFLNVGMDFEKTEDDRVEINIIDAQTDEDTDDVVKDMETAEIEARFCVTKIKDLLAQNTYDAKEGIFREIEYKDIVILLRAVSSWGSIFDEVFFEEGIPFYSDSGAGYFETVEIQIMLNFLKLIDNIRQDIPLLSIMRSFIGKFTIEELIKIRVEHPKSTFVNAFDNYISNFDDDLSSKLKNFKEMIKKYSRRSKYDKLSNIIWSVLIETEYYYFVGALPNGKMRQANLRLLTEKASSYEKTSMIGLYNFLKYVEKLRVSNNDDAGAKILGENDNVVRLMTIHKSKGLEFPVVLLCGLNKKFNLLDMNKGILKHKNYGLVPKYVNTELRTYKQMLPGLAIKSVMKKEILSEEMRVLYVALTRAVDKLILCGTVKNIKSKAKKWKQGTVGYNLINSTSYFDWLCSALYNHDDAEALRKINDIEEEFAEKVEGITEITVNLDNEVEESIVEEIELPIECESSWNIKITSLASIGTGTNKVAENKREKILELSRLVEKIDNERYDEINRRLSFEYHFKESINVPTKLSVTDIKLLAKNKISEQNSKPYDTEQIKYTIPKLTDIPIFKEKNIEFTKAEIGIVTHFVMQHLDLKKDVNIVGIENQIIEMVEKKLLTEEESKVVNTAQIEVFFKSEIGKRMLKSETIKREAPFVTKKLAKDIIDGIKSDDKILVQGIIDCYFYEGDEIVLIDYKTDSTYGNGRIDYIVNQYRAQIIEYKEALEKILELKVKECYLYLFDNGSCILIE